MSSTDKPFLRVTIHLEDGERTDLLVNQAGVAVIKEGSIDLVPLHVGFHRSLNAPKNLPFRPGSSEPWKALPRRRKFCRQS